MACLFQCKGNKKGLISSAAGGQHLRKQTHPVPVGLGFTAPSEKQSESSLSFSSSAGAGKPHRGFTLIELLVVIAIIGLLAAVVMASLNSAREKGRDARRVADLKQVQLALEMYYDENNSYPSTGDRWRGTETTGSCYGSHGTNAIPGLAPTYMPSIPKDPKPNIAAGRCYLYRSNGTDYMFLAHGTVESFDPEDVNHPMDRQAYNQQSIAVYSPGAVNW